MMNETESKQLAETIISTCTSFLVGSIDEKAFKYNIKILSKFLNEKKK